MLVRIKVWAVEIIGCTGQYILLTPFIPFYIMSLLGEWCLEFASWCCADRAWSTWLFDKEIALDGWRTRYVDSLKRSST